MDKDVLSGLSQEIIHTLLQQGVHSVDQLRSLNPQDVALLTQGSSFLSQKQIQELLKIIRQLQTEKGHDTVEKEPSKGRLGQDKRDGRQGTTERTVETQERQDTAQRELLLPTGMDSWAQEHKLTTATLAKLREDGFDSLEELSQLKPDDIDKFYTDKNLLPKAQCLRLKKAVEALNNSSTEGQAMNPRNAGTHGSLGSGFQQSEDEDLDFKLERNLNITTGDGEPVIRFLLVGKTGVGKSTTGNTILGSELFSTSCAFSSQTSKCEVHSKFIFGVNVEVVDTPGLFDTKVGQAEIVQVVAQGVACIHPGPDVFLVLVKIGRFTQEEDGAYKRLVAIFDESVNKYMIVVFTGGDGLSGKTIDDLLETAPPSLKEILEACENRYVVFDNTAADKKPQVKHLLQTAQKLVEKNGNQCYSCPKYFSIKEEMEKEIKRRMELVEKKESRLREYIENLEKKNQEVEKTRAELEEKEKQHQTQLRENQENTEKQINELRKKHEQEQLSNSEKDAEVAKLQKAMAVMEEKLNKQHKKGCKDLQEKEQTAKKELEQMKKKLQKTKEKLKCEQMKTLKDGIAKNEERGFINNLAGGIARTAGWAWGKVFGASE